MGGLIGGFAALLLAPKTGKEFREEFGEESEKWISKAKKDLETATKAAAHSYEKGRDKFIEKMADSKVDENEPVEKKKQSPAKTKKKGMSTQPKTHKKISTKK